MARSILITGGSGYFGTVLAELALARGDSVRILDLNPPGPALAAAEYCAGDVRDRAAVRRACADVDIVFHNVAQVPLAKDRALFDEVNVGGTANVLVAARDARVAKVVHTSSSAVFGIPEHNPVTEATPCRPLEAYGAAKLRAELLCRDAVGGGLDVTIVRPRTVLGHGRLGVIALLFEFVADGAPVFVLGGGHNRYQFVHANDLADACLRAGDRPTPSVYNVGAREFGTMRETLQALVDHAQTGSRLRSLPVAPARFAMRGFVVAGARAVRAVSLAAVQRVALFRHRAGSARARLGAAAFERVDGDRVVRVVPRASQRRERREPVASSIAGAARVGRAC